MADVVIPITIPDAYVNRVQAAVLATLPCGNINAKNCLKAFLIREIKDRVKAYERNRASQDFEDEYSEPTVE